MSKIWTLLYLLYYSQNWVNNFPSL